MDPVPNPESTGLIYRLNAGYRFRIAGRDAKNDGIHVDMDIGYQSQRYFERLSFETGSTLDFFGETSHLGAYFQLNFHKPDRWIFSLRTIGAGASDDKEDTGSNQAADTHDFGGIFALSLMGAYQLNSNFILGLRVGYNLQAYGEKGSDQGTQHSLTTLANLAYQF